MLIAFQEAPWFIELIMRKYLTPLGSEPPLSLTVCLSLSVSLSPALRISKSQLKYLREVGCGGMFGDIKLLAPELLF